ncbi:transposable element Tcb1 transposase [Trichonephila clavipes]|nr:transposable element Tcb1 transposase [Trichonephila clavipes]
MFFDESRFSLQSDSHRTLIWRAPGTCYQQEKIIERHRYVGAGWLVWGGIILGSRTDLHVQSVTVTYHIYRDVILEQHVRLFRGVMGAEFLFMHDNAHPHRAIIVDECLQSEDFTRMDWSAYSPDLNPIEHVWDMLGRRIATRQPPPTYLPELRRTLLDEWYNIPQDHIDNLILSMPRLWACDTGQRNVGTLNGSVREEFSTCKGMTELSGQLLAEGHLESRRPLSVLPLTPTHRRLLLEWCRTRGSWTTVEWNQVDFSDESIFNISSDDNRVRVWRPCSDRLNPAFALQQLPAPTAGVMVWGAITWLHDSPAVCP